MEIDEIDEAMANLILALDNLKLADPLVNITANEYNGLVSTQLPTEGKISYGRGVLQQMQVHAEEDSSNEEEATISVQMGREALELAKNFRT